MVSWRIETHDSLASTQDLIKKKIIEAEGLVVQAKTQTSGRGRHGRVWTGGDDNLYMSLLLKPDCTPNRIGQLSLLISLSLYEAVAGLIGRNPVLKIKWPNDLLLDCKKCAGILIETEIDQGGKISAAMVGIGLNVMSAPLEGSACLKDYGQNQPDLQEVMASVLDRISNNYKIWQTTGFDAIRSSWLRHSHKQLEELSVKMPDRIYQGKFNGIDDYGNLLLGMQDKQMKISAGEVFTSNDQGQIQCS